jgi:glutamate formiminotransferase
MDSIIEIVPNISEGCDLGVVKAIAEYVEDKSGLKILDIHSDSDHNRSVYTLLGQKTQIMEAAFRLVEKASLLIDVNKHFGVHPFIGSTDVLPFIAVKGDPKTAVECAKLTGQKIWKELGIPVYLYGEANPDSERFNLSNIRKGGLDGLKNRIHDFTPDIGKPKLHPKAGAIAVGARNYLIAFNVNLKTDNLVVTKEIARSLREKHGGLPGVRALGVSLKSRGITQVTMNLIDYRKTGLKTAFTEVKTLAQANGIDVIESEIVGMVPPDAVFPAMEIALKLTSPINILPIR